MTTGHTNVSAHAMAVPSEPLIGGFWRRLAAFLIDALIVGIFGLALGYAFFDFFAALGIAGRIVGYAIALAYFATLNSQIGHGQTVGKRLLGLRVIGRDGSLISPGRAALRESVLAVPFFLNGAYWPVSIDPDVGIPLYLVAAGILLALIVFGGIGTTIYLFIFNKGTRQSLHDLVVGTFVVRVTSLPVAVTRRIWRPHVAIIAAFGALVLVGIITMLYVVPIFYGDTLKPLLAIQRTLMERPDVRVVTVQTVHGFAGPEPHNLVVTAVLKEWPRDPQATMADIAIIVLKQDPGSASASRIVIQLIYGFDIGIATGKRSEIGNFTPADLSRRVGSQ